MSSTKIINVLKDDKFEEILNIFKETPAREVIFVLPRKSKAFKAEEHFMVLGHEAQQSDKNISILCSSPEINSIAQKYGFDVLLTKKEGKTKPMITAVNQVDDDDERDANDDDDTEDEDIEETNSGYVGEPIDKINKDKKDKSVADDDIVIDEDNDHEDETDEEDTVHAVGAAAHVDYPRKNIDMLFSSGRNKSNVKIKKGREAESPIDIKTDDDNGIFDNLKEVWKKEGTWARRSTKSKISLNWLWGSKIRNIAIGSVMAVLLAVGGIVYATVGTAKIVISPQKRDADYSIKMMASDSLTSADEKSNKIPGQFFLIEKTASQIFPATGEKDVAQKAKGKITVYNGLAQPQPLVATTRFSSADGHVFRTLKSIVVPASKGNTSGSISVEVIADRSGSDYNVPAGKFIITAFKEKGDTLRAEKIYGMSDKAMAGGTNGKAKVVTESDVNSANDSVLATLKSQILDELKSQASGLRMINTGDISVSKTDVSANVDEPADNFTVTITGFLKSAGVRDSDLYKVVSSHAEKTDNVVALPEKMAIEFENTRFINQNQSNGIEFTTRAKGSTYSKVDNNKITMDLLGKGEEQIKSYLSNAPGLDTAKVLLSPFWVSKIPKNKDKVSIEISYQ